VESIEKHGFLPVKLDLANIDSVEASFNEVHEKLGIPNVVVLPSIFIPTVLM
jgi:hypothetical protein